MINKKYLKPGSIAILLFVALVIGIFLERTGQFEGVKGSVLALGIYSLVFLSYGLRIALIAIGLIALYRALWKSVNDKDWKRREV